MFFEQLSNGLAIGSSYALTAIGYTLVYGIIRMINFAHGDIFMIGAFSAFTAISILRLPIIVSLIFGVLMASILGYLIARFAYKPVFNAPRINLFLCAVGVSYLLQNFALLVWGPDTKPFPINIDHSRIQVGGFVVSKIQLIIIITSVVLVLILDYVVKHTKFGRAMRSVSQDMDVASLMGVQPYKIVYLTFIIGSALGCVAGILVGIYYNALYPTMGFTPGLKAFISAVVGGIGSIPGAMLGGLIMGVAESLGAAYISSGYRDATAYIILIIILLVRPQGILGRTEADKA